MRRRRFLASLAALALAAGLLGGPAGAQEAPTIVGGTEADEGEYPFAVAMISSADATAPFSVLCGGALVRPNWVLTADHCVAAKTPASIDMLVGAWDRRSASSGTRFDVIGFVRHPTADVALVELAAGAATPMVALATPADAGLYPPGAAATVIGWGFTQNTPPETPDPADKLREIELPIVSDADCDAAWGGAIDDPFEICAGGEADRDACNGDSGSPMLVRDGAGDWLQIGLVSSGTNYPGCGQAGKPGIYAQIDAVAAWVEDNAGPPPASLCDGLEATIEGTDASETINGTNGNDVIAAGAGDDVVNGRGGVDVLCGEEGNDVLNGGAGADLLIGGPGDDALNGDSGDDTASFAAAPGPVTVDLGAGTATGDGADTLSKVWNVVGSDHDDSLTGNAGINDLWGGPGDDYLHGKAKDDALYGGAGNDVMNGRGGDDLLVGGTGTDLATYLQSPSGVVVDLGAQRASGGHGNDTLRSVENVRGSKHADSITGSARPNLIYGSKGDDELFGRSGNDTLRGNEGFDTAYGQGGTADFCRTEVRFSCEL